MNNTKKIKPMTHKNSKHNSKVLYGVIKEIQDEQQGIMTSPDFLDAVITIKSEFNKADLTFGTMTKHYPELLSMFRKMTAIVNDPKKIDLLSFEGLSKLADLVGIDMTQSIVMKRRS